MSKLHAFGAWRRDRPFVGALLIAIAGVEMFFSTQLDIGKLHIQLGVEGFQATIIPIGFVLLGVLIALMPQHRIFYGVIALALSLYSIIGVNLGGFIIGMLLSAVGGILAVSWAPPAAAGAAAGAGESSSEAVQDAAALEDARAGARATDAEPVDAEPVLVSVGAGSHDGELHAEFAPYSTLVAISGAARSPHAAA